MKFPRAGRPSAAGEDGAEAGFGEDAGDGLALVALDFDLAVLDGAAGAAAALHGLGQLLFFRQADAYEVFHDGHGLAAAPGFDAEDVDAAAIFLRRLRTRGIAGDLGRRFVGAWRQAVAGQSGKGRLRQGWSGVGGDAFGV